MATRIVTTAATSMTVRCDHQTNTTNSTSFNVIPLKQVAISEQFNVILLKLANCDHQLNQNQQTRIKDSSRKLQISSLVSHLFS